MHIADNRVMMYLFILLGTAGSDVYHTTMVKAVPALWDCMTVACGCSGSGNAVWHVWNSVTCAFNVTLSSCSWYYGSGGFIGALSPFADRCSA